MKRVWVLILSLAAAGGASRAMAQYNGRVPAVDARALIHQDGTRTDLMKDPLKHEMTETTYDARGVVISQKKYLLNENGDPTQGQIFDGAGNLIARVQFTFDDLQRLSEERCLNMQGEIFRRVLHLYDPSSGKALPLKAMDYKVHAPNMRVATIDFTRSGRGAAPKGPTAPAGPVQPGQTPQIESVSSATGQTYAIDPAQSASVQQQVQAQQAAAANKPKEKKKSFLGGLFGKKDKDAK